MTPRYEFAVIGAGVVGCAIAMELTRRGAPVALIEAAPDIGAGTSKANSAILHTGFDAPPGSLEARLLRRGYVLFHERSEALGLPIARTGGLVIAWSGEQAAKIPGILEKGKANAVAGLRRVERDELYKLEPNLGTGAVGAVQVPGESITCPFTPVISFATNAIRNGAALYREFPVTGVERRRESWVLISPGQPPLEARSVINAAGLASDEIDRLFGHSRFTVRPRKGEFVVYDKPARRLLDHILLPIPAATTKGVLVAPTVFGNVLVGPTAIDQEDKRDTSVSAASLGALAETGRRILPGLEHEYVTATYAGLRAATEHGDYQIHFYPEEKYTTVGGIRSTGLSASLGIAEYVAGELAGEPQPGWKPHRAPAITDLALRVCHRAEWIARDPAYGSVICHCEWVTRGELRDALASPIPPVDLDGLKRRTRAGLGRCQGFNCQAEIAALLTGGRP